MLVRKGVQIVSLKDNLAQVAVGDFRKIRPDEIRIFHSRPEPKFIWRKGDDPGRSRLVWHEPHSMPQS